MPKAAPSKASPPKIVSPPRWQQVPSEEILSGEFGVSRPTIRQGVATLVREGLLTVRRPFGTIVRDPYAAPARIEHRGLTAPAYTESDPAAWTDVGTPVFVRADASVDQAAMLAIEPGDPMLTREVLQESDGVRRAMRLCVPFSVAADLDTPWLDDPHLPTSGEVYAWFAAHGKAPTFTERVRTRMPVGDEITDLRATPGTPLLVVLRVATTVRPVSLEETRMAGEHTELAYPLPVPTMRQRR
jgi:GntR family transcriptional regulator